MTVARPVGDVLAQHTVFEVECMDRMYLKLRAGIAVRGRPGGLRAPPAGVADRLDRAPGQDHRRVWCRGAPVRPHPRHPVGRLRQGPAQGRCHARAPAGFTPKEGVLFIGRAQEKTALFRTEKRRDSHGDSYPWIVKTTGLVNHFYF